MAKKSTLEELLLTIPGKVNEATVGIEKDEEETQSRVKSKVTSKTIADTLLQVYDFIIIDNQLHCLDKESQYYKIIFEGTAHREFRKLLMDIDMYTGQVNKYVLSEVYEWLLLMAYHPSNEELLKGCNYLNFKDCAYNWVDDYIEEKRKKLYFTYSLPFEYKKLTNSGKNYYRSYINDLYGDDKDTRKEFRKFLGLVLSDIRTLKLSFFLYGPPNTGKSLFQNVLCQLVGEESCASVSFTQMSNEFAVTQLLGKRLNVSGEVSGATNNRLDIYKSLTGNDKITTCYKGKDYFQFTNRSLLVFACNNFPPITQNLETDSLISRIIIFPCNHQKKREEWIPNLEELILQDSKDIINDAIKGLKALRKDSFCFNESEAMKECKKEFIGQADSFSLFMNDKLEPCKKSKLSTKEIQMAYAEYCQENEYYQLADNIWPRILKRQINCKPTTMTSCVGSRIRGYDGVRFKIDITDISFDDNVMTEDVNTTDEIADIDFEEEDYNGEN